jgi:hypothetical protein
VFTLNWKTVKDIEKYCDAHPIEKNTFFAPLLLISLFAASQLLSWFQ